MKKMMFAFLLAALICASGSIFAQGLEDFTNFPATGNTYQDGTFTGLDGSTWTYWQSRGDMLIGTGPTPCLGKGRTPTSEVISGTINNGCGTLSFDYMQAFSTNVSLDVFVNGLLVANVTSNAETGVVKNSGPIVVNTPGSFTFDFKQNSSSAGQVSIDNVTWTSYTGSVLPEPTNYPTAFAGVPSPFTVNLTWIDAVGAQVPTAYIILASNQPITTLPQDGVPIADDPNLADGSGSLNILQGVQNTLFTNLPSNTPYYFKIFPYTNSGPNIDYKTDGSAPESMVTTPNTVIIESENFNAYSLGDWMGYNVLGPQIWMIDSIHGVGSSACAKMSGFASTSNENEDWLISPPMNFTEYIHELLTFQNAYKYAGPVLDVFISTNYDGVSDPTEADWTQLNYTMSPGNWVWTPSGNIDVSGFNANPVYIGFRYTSTSTESTTWELDDIVITGDLLIGMDEQGPEPAGFSIVPNPAGSQCRLIFNGSNSREVRIVSVVGNLVYTDKTTGSSLAINTASLAPGVYFVQVNDLVLNKQVVKKLIVR
jgi:hypothetical protein